MKDITGERYGRLVITARTRMEHNTYYVMTVCDCGTVKEIALKHLRSGRTQSCGCLQQENRTKHGHCGTRTHQAWRDMWSRTRLSEKHPRYHCYAGKGIKVCERWKEFANFLEDMGECPEGLTLDRIDRNGDYFKENCRWTTVQVQARNQGKRQIGAYSSKYKGVYWSRQKSKWHTRIRLDGKHKHLGFFADEVEAARAYNREAEKHFGFELNEL